MADVTIRIEALDLTQNAVRSAMNAFRQLSNEANKNQASAVITRSFNEMSKGALNFEKMSTRSLRRMVVERARAIRTMEAMETRFQLRIISANSKSQRQLARQRRERTRVIRTSLTRETREVEREIKRREKVEREAQRNATRREREKTRQHQRELREREKRARAYNKQVEREAREAERLERQRLQRRRARYQKFFSALRSAGFNLIFAGSLTGSQASLLGSGLGQSLGGIATTLRGGFKSLNQLIQKTIRLFTQLSATAVRIVGGISALFISLFGNLLGSIAAFIPKVGIFFTGLLVGTTNLVAGIARGLTEVIAGFVEVAGGLIEGLVETASFLVTKALGIVTDVIGGIFSALGKVLGKVGELASKVFGKIVGAGIGALTSSFQKIAKFRSALADVFVQTPEIGAEKFALIRETIEDIAKTLPLAKVDLAKGLFEIVSTQLTRTPEEALQVLQGVSRATVAGGAETDVFSVSQAATGVLSAYNIEASRTEEVLSKMFKAAVLGRFNFKQLSDGIQAVSGIAANFNVELNDLLSTIVLASKSLRPREVFVGTKNLVLSLAAPTFEAKRSMDQLGISLKNYTADEKKALDLRTERIRKMEVTIRALERLEKKNHRQTNALRDLRRALKAAKDEFALFERATGKFVGLGAAIERIAALNLSPEQTRRVIPERRALAAFAAIVSAQDRAQEAIKAISEETGQAVEYGVGIQTQTLENQIKLVRNNIEALFDGLYDVIEPALLEVLRETTRRLQEVGQIFEETYKTTGKSIQVTIGEFMLDVVKTVFDTVDWIVANWGKIVTGAKQAFQVVATIAKALFQIGKLIANSISDAFGGEEAFAEKVKRAWEDVRKFVEGVWKGIQEVAEGNMEPIYGLINGLKIVWAQLLDYMRSSLANFLQQLEGPLNKLFNEARDLAIQASHPIASVGGNQTPTEVAETRRGFRFEVTKRLAGAGRQARATTFPEGGAATGAVIEDASGRRRRGGPTSESEAAFERAFNNSVDRMLQKMQAGQGNLFGSIGNKVTESEIRVWLAQALMEALTASGRANEIPKGLTQKNVSSGGLAYQGARDRLLESQLGGEARVDRLIEELEENAEGFAEATQLLHRFGITSEEAKDKFGKEKIVDFSAVVESLNTSLEEQVRQDLENAKAEEENTQALNALNEAMNNLGRQGIPIRIGAGGGGFGGLGGFGGSAFFSGVSVVPGNGGNGGAGGPVGVPGVQGPAGPGPAAGRAEQRQIRAQEALENIEHNTASTVNAIETGDGGGVAFSGGAAASAGQTQHPFFGVAPPEGTFRDPKDSDNFAKVLQEAIQSLREREDEDEEPKTKTGKKLSKQEIVRLRKAHNRRRLARANLPFGAPVGIRKGPLGATIGKPRYDKDGNVIGFTERPDPFRGRVRVSNRREEARKASIARQKAAREKRRRQKELFAGALDYIGDPAQQPDLAPESQLALGQASGILGPTDPKTGQPVAPAKPGTEEAAKQAEQVKAAVEAGAEKEEEVLEKLGDAMTALEEELNDDTKGLLDFSEEQVKALEEVGINAAELGNMVLEGTGRVSDVVEALIKKITDLKSKHEDRLRRLEAAASDA